MNYKLIIKTLIILLFIFFVIILILLYNSKKLQNNNLNDIKYDELVENDNDDDIYYYEDETGSAEYNQEQLKNLDISISNIPENVSKYILNKEEFDLNIKEYVYLNGLVDATKVEYKKYEEDKEKKIVKIFFQLNNTDKNSFMVILKLNDNSIEIIDNEFSGKDEQ